MNEDLIRELIQNDYKLISLKRDIDLLQEVLYKSKEEPEVTVDGHGRITRAVPSNYITELKGRIDRLEGNVKSLRWVCIIFAIIHLLSMVKFGIRVFA